MKRILHVLSSPRDGESNSIRLGNKVVEKLLEQYPGSQVTLNNVLEKGYEHLSSGHIAGYFLPEESKTPELARLTEPSDAAVEQLIAHDIIVISLPVYNFSLPSALKAWIDHIVRAGKTFKYGNGAAEGLLVGKKVYLAIASNGVYSEGPYKAFDFAEPYLRFILGFIGLRDITTFRVEGTAMPDLKDAAVEKGLMSVAV